MMILILGLLIAALGFLIFIKAKTVGFSIMGQLFVLSGVLTIFNGLFIMVPENMYKCGPDLIATSILIITASLIWQDLLLPDNMQSTRHARMWTIVGLLLFVIGLIIYQQQVKQ